MWDFITVVFRDELPLLQIQATSFAQYVNPQDVNSITVVVNDSADVIQHIDATWWGPLAHHVVVEPRRFEPRILGWESQQLCKLLAAANATAPWSMVLDAKTWFVTALDIGALVDHLGRPRVGIDKIMPVFASSQQFVRDLYQIDFNETLGPNGVPFIFHTDTVRSLVNSQEDFVEFFQTSCRYPNLVTEFHLYSGYVTAQHQTLEHLYSPDRNISVWNLADFQLDYFDQWWQRLITSTVLTASIHRRCYAQLNQEQLELWFEFLIKKQLICNRKKGLDLLNSFM
jgi:hypothetical protein